MKYFLYAAAWSIIIGLFVWQAGWRIQSNTSYISPLPDFLTLGKNNQVTLLDLWLPFLTEAYGEVNDLTEITAKSVLVYDLSTKKVIYEKNSLKRMPMASLTKIMTAIVALESMENIPMLVTERDLVGENSMGLVDGDIMMRNDLLYGLLLPSGNDAAEVLANNYPDGGREAFLQAMNNKMKTLGLQNTKFTNPSGLQGDGEQYSTAYDLLVLTRYALENHPLFTQIVATPVHEIAHTADHQAYTLYNETNLLTTYEGVKGVKTGYTPEAGYCLVTYLDYEGHRLIGIILNSENRRLEMKVILDYSLRALGLQPPVYTGVL